METLGTIKGTTGEYHLPTGQFIRRHQETEKLYKLESQVTKAIQESAKELATIMGHSKEELYKRTIPEALHSVLDSFDGIASEAAAMAFLIHRGYKVKPPKERLTDANLGK